MPLYEYECDACGDRFEIIRKFSDPPVEKCPKCGGPVRKLMSSPAFQFKGSGWYVTDYPKKDQAGGAKSDQKSESTEKHDEKSEKGDKADKTGKADKTDKNSSTSGDSPSTTSSSTPSSTTATTTKNKD